MSENYLAHHGRLGQKWGKKNGPPYPLDFNKLSAEEKAKAKEETIRKGDIRTAGANKIHYTDQELNAVMNRFDLNQRLSKLNASQIESGANKVKKICNTLGSISDYGEKAIKGYNTIAKLSNSVAGTKLPKIGDNNQNGGKKNKQDNKKNS